MPASGHAVVLLDMNILILGGNGFIGLELAFAFLKAGCKIACIGRNNGAAKYQLPAAQWHDRDLSQLKTANNWLPYLGGIDVVVNCAGVLQQGLRDKPFQTQHRAMAALYVAARQSGLRIVQISANTGGPASGTAFLSTKKAADDLLKASGLAHTIIRPALVVGRNAHGGTALVRSLAAMPWVIPLALRHSEIRTADMRDLCDLVLEAAHGSLGDAGDIVIASADGQTLEQAVLAHRAWLGLGPVRVVEVPALISRLAGRLADLTGWLGWRSPLRSTALKVLAGGVEGQQGLATRTSRSLRQTLAENPAGAQDVWFARLYLLKPAIMACLSFFWLASGLTALARLPQSAAMLAQAGFSETVSTAIAIAASLADCVLGIAAVWHRWVVPALLGMIGLSLAYLAAGTILSPQIWLDPLGPYLKVIPGILLAMVALAICRER